MWNIATRNKITTPDRAYANLNLPAALAVILAVSGCSYWEVDKCLDRGGRWVQEREQCEFE